ncbi:MAG: NTP transferase domain-containing protein [Dehalococcoidia bacterium]|tara:strand:- start:1942 stop:2547 length:606 start_codon:yes stop_codon:yes gene_type:complete
MITAGLILAAGQSSRMKQQKALLPWKEKTLIEWEIECFNSAGIKKIFVIVGSQYSNIAEKIKDSGVNIIINHDWEKGRSTSILCGIQAILSENKKTPIDNFLIQNVDQPITEKILIDMMNFAHTQKNFEVIQPFFENKNRHPIILHIDQASKFLDIQNDNTSLRDIIKNLDVKTIEVNSPLLNINLNNISDYRNAMKQFKS